MTTMLTYPPTNISKILKYKKKLEKVNMDDENKVLTYLKKVENLGLDQALLSETKIGITVNRFRRKKGPVATAAARIIENWMEMVKRNLNAAAITPEESKDTSPSTMAPPALPKKAPKVRRRSLSPPAEKAPETVAEGRPRVSDADNGASTSAAAAGKAKVEVKVKVERQGSVLDGVSASSGLSFAELMSTGDGGSKKRKARLPGDSTAPPSAKRTKMAPAVTEADIRASLSQPDIDYCEHLGDQEARRRYANGSPAKGSVAASDDLYAPLKLNSRSQVYSGRSRAHGVMTLKESCLNVLYHHVDEVGPMGEAVVFHVVQSFLERLNVSQLERIERWNPHFVPDDDILWERHCRRDFKSCREVAQGPGRTSTWRQLYARLRDDKERRLDSLTRAISANKVKATEGERKAKIAFASSTPKAPRDVRRRQAKFGTNRLDAMELAAPKLINEGAPRKFVTPQVEPIGGVVVKVEKKKKSNQMKKLISSIKRVGYRH